MVLHVPLGEFTGRDVWAYLPGIFFAKGGRQEPGMAGDLQKIAEMKRKNAEEQG